MDMSDFELKPLCTVSNEIEANMVTALLEAAKIPAMTQNTSAGSALGAYCGFSNTAKIVLVREADYEAAEALLEEQKTAAAQQLQSEQEDEEDEEDD